MARRLVAVGLKRRQGREHVWRTEEGWFRAASLAHPLAPVEGPFGSRAEAEGSRVAVAVSASGEA